MPEAAPAQHSTALPVLTLQTLYLWASRAHSYETWLRAGMREPRGKNMQQDSSMNKPLLYTEAGSVTLKPVQSVEEWSSAERPGQHFTLEEVKLSHQNSLSPHIFIDSRHREELSIPNLFWEFIFPQFSLILKRTTKSNRQLSIDCNPLQALHPFSANLFVLQLFKKPISKIRGKTGGF